MLRKGWKLFEVEIQPEFPGDKFTLHIAAESLRQLVDYVDTENYGEIVGFRIISTEIEVAD